MQKKKNKKSAKTGLPPGTLFYTGTNHAVKTKIEFTQFNEQYLHVEENLSIDKIKVEYVDPVKDIARAKLLAEKYKVEPYVMSADIYSNPQHQGRGGWSWYTGSAGWMYRLITENLLGMRLENGTLIFENFCLPEEWKEYRIHYRFHNTFYHITFNIVNYP